MPFTKWERKLSVGSSSLDNSSLLDINSTTKGTRPVPSMDETARDLISTPVEGLQIYNTTAKEHQFYNGTVWKAVGAIVPLDKFDATTAPLISNDNTEGYSIGSTWVDITNDKAYKALDVSTGAAVWDRLTNIKIKTDATSAPLVSNDNTEGYEISSVWIDVTNNKSYTAVDVSTGAAVWENTDGIFNNFSAVLDPLVSNDNTEGYEVGSRWINTDNDKAFTLVDSSTGAAIWIEGGGSGGGGELNFYADGGAEDADAVDFSEGNDPIFNDAGAGATNSTFSITSVNPGRGANSFSLVLHATPGTSDDDFVASPASGVPIPLAYRGRDLGLKLQYKYDGADGDIKIVIEDATNTTILSTGVEVIENATDWKEFVFSFFCPLTCANIELGPQIITHATGSEILLWDDVIITPNPFVYKNLVEFQEISHTSAASTLLDRDNEVRFTLANLVDNGDRILSIVDDSGSTRTKFVAIKDCIVNIAFSAVKTNAASSRAGAVWLNGTSIMFGGAEASSSTNFRAVGTPLKLSAGDFVSVGIINDVIVSDSNPAHLRIVAQAESENVVTPISNSAPIRYSRTTNQLINNSSVTIVDFATKTFDRDALVSTGAAWKYTFKESGTIRVRARIGFDGVATWNDGEAGLLLLFKNGVQYSKLEQDELTGTPAGTFGMNLDGSDLVKGVKGDTIDIRVSQNTGGAINIPVIGGGNDSYVTIEKIDQNATLGYFPTQRNLATHFLTADQTSNDGDIADLRFINLVVGDWYTLEGQVVILYSSGSGSNCGISAVHNGGGILRLSKTGATDSNQDTQCGVITFKAEATTITFTTSGGNFSGTKSVLGDGTHVETWFKLREGKDIIETTQWDV